MKPHLLQTLRAFFIILLPFLFVACSASTATTPGSTNIEAWLTLGDKSKLLSSEPGLSFTPGRPASGKTIEIDSATLYQQFEGAGAAMTDSSAWLIMNKLDESARQELMRTLFTREGNGIGLSYLRLPMGASDFSLKDYTYNDLLAGKTDENLEQFSIAYDRTHIIPALKLALDLNPQLGLMGSPWSAPAWMKKNNQLHGSYLLPEFYQAFADYHVRFVQAYAAEGITIDAITAQNEPLHVTEGYPSMYMSAEEQQEFVRDYLGAAFRAAGLKTKIIIYDHNWDRADYPLTVLSDPSAAAFVDGVAFHCYGGDVSAQSRVHEQYPQKGIWFTECSGGGWATNFGDNLSWNITNLVVGNFRNWGKSVLLWNLALDEKDGPQNGGCTNCRGVVTIDQSSRQITYNEEYYVLGHVSKFIDPGAYRIESSSGAGVPNNVAFLNPDGSIVVIVQSDSAVDFNLAWNEQYFSYHLPQGGVVTLKWNANVQAVATATSVAMPTSTPRPTVARGTIPDSGLLLDFENNPSIFASQNAEASLGEIAYSGRASLRSESSSGNWHIVGANFPQVFDISGFEKLCFWVYDTTVGDDGNTNNTIGVRLTDASGVKEGIWSDHQAAGSNPRTVRNSWVQMCMNLSGYTLIDLSNVTAIELETYWAGDTYFDDISVEGSNR
jgi:glucosylceramidase